MIRVSLALMTWLALLGWSGEALTEEREVALRLGPVELLGDGPSHAEVGLGVFDVYDEGEGATSGAVHVQFRWGRKLWLVGPALGLMANTDGGVFGYGGVYAEVALGPVIVTPLLGVGGYAEGDSKDLGGVLQFRSALGIAYAFGDGTRLGVRVAHLSNAGIHASNPGEEEVYITYSVPVSWPFR